MRSAWPTAMISSTFASLISLASWSSRCLPAVLELGLAEVEQHVGRQGELLDHRARRLDRRNGDRRGRRRRFDLGLRRRGGRGRDGDDGRRRQLGARHALARLGGVGRGPGARAHTLTGAAQHDPAVGRPHIAGRRLRRAGSAGSACGAGCGGAPVAAVAPAAAGRTQPGRAASARQRAREPRRPRSCSCSSSGRRRLRASLACARSCRSPNTACCRRRSRRSPKWFARRRCLRTPSAPQQWPRRSGAAPTGE